MNEKHETVAAAPVQHKRRRIRLSPQLRREQILDAALIEFSAVGFEGATMDKIAQRVGLTKAGLYAHFDSKDAIFEGLLLSNLFDPSTGLQTRWPGGTDVETSVDLYLENVYTLIRDPRVQATFRLLLAESGRVPERAARWHEAIFEPYRSQRERELEIQIESRMLPDRAVTRSPALHSAPVLLAMVSYLMCGEEAARSEVAKIRAAHREILLTMLRRDAD